MGRVVLFIVFVCLCANNLVAQKKFIPEEKLLHYYLVKENDWLDSLHIDSVKEDVTEPAATLSMYQELFKDSLFHFISANPATITYPFKALQDEHWAFIKILTSADKNLRIYSWDDMSGSAERFYANVYQYKSNKKVNVKMVVNSDSTEGGGFCYGLWTLKNNGKTYYIIAEHAQFAAYQYLDQLRVVDVENGKLNDSVKIIKIDSTIQGVINYEWKPTGQFRSKEGYEYDNNIQYDEKTKMLKIPVVYPDGYLAKEFTLYRFNGQYFEKVKQK